MKFIVSILLTAFIAYTMGVFSFLPWYSFVFGVAIVSWGIQQKPLLSFTSGFIAVFLLWLVLAILKDVSNNHLLSIKVANILPLNGSYVILILITAFIGGLLGGFSALTGSYCRKKK
ncbi:MAG: hypothetical protein ACOVNY_10245 [Chitinophagaceae bacterium]